MRLWFAKPQRKAASARDTRLRRRRRAAASRRWTRKACGETLVGPKGVAPSHTGPAPRGYGSVEIIAAPLGVDFEATIALEGYYPVGPQSRQALKGLGVGHVEEF